ATAPATANLPDTSLQNSGARMQASFGGPAQPAGNGMSTGMQPVPQPSPPTTLGNGPVGFASLPTAPQPMRLAQNGPSLPGSFALPGAPSPVAPDRRADAIARAGVLAELSGMPNIAAPLAQAYYNSPGYLSQAETAKQGAGYPFQAGLKTLEADLQLRNRNNRPVFVPGIGLVNPAQAVSNL